MRKELLMPLTGVAFIALLILSFVVGGEPPDVEDPVQEIVDHYVDDKDSIIAGAFISGLAAVVLVFFANHLRNVMRASATSATILVGAGIVAVAAGIDATISMSIAEAAEDVDPTAVQALQALWDNDFIPFAIGLVVFVLSLGLSILQTGVLPKWLGWVALAIGLIGVTPIGFFAFPLTGLLILVVSVMLALRARRPAAAGGAPMGPPD